MVVLQGASLENAATGLMVGAFSNSGQTCISVERAYVQEQVYEEFMRQLIEKTRVLKLGWSRSWDVDMGSLINADHAGKVLNRIERAVDEGARFATGGKLPARLGPALLHTTNIANGTARAASS